MAVALSKQHRSSKCPLRILPPTVAVSFAENPRAMTMQLAQKLGMPRKPKSCGHVCSVSQSREFSTSR